MGRPGSLPSALRALRRPGSQIGLHRDGGVRTRTSTSIEYAVRLLRAGVAVDLHQWLGAFHGSTAVLPADVSKRELAEINSTLRNALPRAIALT